MRCASPFRRLAHDRRVYAALAPWLTIAALAAATACSEPAATRPPPATAAQAPRTGATFEPSAAPAALRPAVEAADAAFGALKRRLKGELHAAMVKGGPVKAVWVCRDVAPKTARALLGAKSPASAAKVVALGRTSHKLRNPKNRAPSWVAPYVARAARGAADAAKPVVVALGPRRVGVLRPLRAIKVCLRCHGDKNQMDEKLRAALRTAYPKDQATGFTNGALRGFLWAEVRLPRR